MNDFLKMFLNLTVTGAVSGVILAGVFLADPYRPTRQRSLCAIFVVLQERGLRFSKGFWRGGYDL